MMWRRTGAYEELTPIATDPRHIQVLDHCPKSLLIPPNANARVTASSSSSSSSNQNHQRGSADNEQLSVDNDVVYTIRGYQFCWTRYTLFHILAWLPFCGLPHLLALWLPQIRSWKYRKSHLSDCDYVLLENNLDLLQLIPVQRINDVEDPAALANGQQRTPLFLFEEIRYKFSGSEGKFVAIKSHHEGRTIEEICSIDYGIDEIHRNDYADYFGPNDIRINVKSYWTLFTEEIVNPFYLFQIFSITLWSLDDYYYYAACVLTLSAISIGTSLYQTKKQSLTLRDLVERSRPQLVTIKQRVTATEFYDSQISPIDLLPSDQLIIENGLTLPCDLLLIQGSCIVNECMLTGESIPVNKVAVDSHDKSVFNENLYKRNILYAGTEIILAKGGHATSNSNTDLTPPVLAIVLNVGFATSKGQLIKSILFPKPIGFKFYKDSMRFVLLLFCCAVFGMLYSVRLYLRRNQDFRTMLFGTLDVITIIVPPSLPMAMTAGTIYSQNRLKKRGIFCVSPPQINVCGKMKLCCFDKTGTLTEDGLTYFGYLNVGVHGAVNEQLKSLVPINLFDKFLQGMATCHSLIAHNNELLGDPLDVEMFGATDWQLMERGPYLPAPRSVIPRSEIGKSLEHDLPYVIGIYKDYEFTSERQSMSVVVQILGHDNFIMFAKGAPEKIRSKLAQNSIPSNFDAVLSRYAMRGYRVLALAYKEFPAKVKLTDLAKKSRDDLERDLYFLGFIVFENKLKPETAPTVRDLKQAALRIVMATGDNILTAVSVARESGIVEAHEKVYKLEYNDVRGKLYAEEVKSGGSRRRESNETNVVVNFDTNNTAFYDHFAMDGASWEAVRRNRPELITRILTRGTIFARFRPEQKSELVLGLQDMDYIVTMCGDGANDCTALKAANIGVSLSQAEASVAAPFTSNRQNIACIKDLALEGRCALVTSFAIFKYMILYSVIQFCTVLILYTYCTTLGNFQFLYIDLIITASIAFSMGLQEPTRELAAKRPSSSLISPNNVIPLFVQIVGCVLMQIGAVVLLTHQKWYPGGELEERCYHNETMRQRITFHGGSENEYNGRRLGAERSVICWENTAVFLISCFQYLVLGLVYSKGKPFRKPFYTNITFVAIFLSLTTFTLILLLQPPEPLAEFFELKNLFNATAEENVFRYYLLVFPMVHIVTALVVELGMADRPWLKKAVHWITRKTRPRNKFKMLDSQFNVDSEWIEFEGDQGVGNNGKRGG